MIRENKVYSDRILSILLVFYGLILFIIPEFFINKFDENSYYVLIKERALFCFAAAAIIWKISDFSIYIYLKIMEKRVEVKVSNYINQFKEDVKVKMTELGMLNITNNNISSDLLCYIFDYQSLEGDNHQSSQPTTIRQMSLHLRL